MASFSERLVELRKTSKLTQQQLATELNIHARGLQNYESGRIPEASILIKLADFFGVSLDYLLGRSNNRQDSISVSGNPKAHFKDRGNSSFPQNDRWEASDPKNDDNEETTDPPTLEIELRASSHSSGSQGSQSAVRDRMSDGYEAEEDRLKVGRLPDQNPLGIELSNEQLNILRDVMSDPNIMLMFQDFAKSTEDERRMMLDVWSAIRKKGDNASRQS